MAQWYTVKDKVAKECEFFKNTQIVHLYQCWEEYWDKL